MSDRGFGHINVYQCEKCLEVTVTEDVDEGTTPFMILCRKQGCDGMAKSALYRVNQNLKATHEWYRPETTAGLDHNTARHAQMGGLLLREKGAPA